MIQVKVNADLVNRRLTDLEQKQLPFATARALTWLAMDVQKEERRELPRRFTIRNTWVAKGIRIKPAKKTRLVAEVYSRDDFMERQEEGGTKRPKQGQHLAVPVDARRNKRGIITKANRPTSIKMLFL